MILTLWQQCELCVLCFSRHLGVHGSFVRFSHVFLFIYIYIYFYVVFLCLTLCYFVLYDSSVAWVRLRQMAARGK